MAGATAAAVEEEARDGMAAVAEDAAAAAAAGRTRTVLRKAEKVNGNVFGCLAFFNRSLIRHGTNF
jgi:hypothetical protein